MKLVKSTQRIFVATIITLAVAQAGYGQSITELQHFQSAVRGNTIAFDWSLVQGDHVKAFGVERAGADFRFETIGTVTVRPTHQSSSTYRFTDQSPLSGAAFYRLKIMDHDGNVEYCKVISQAVTAPSPTGR